MKKERMTLQELQNWLTVNLQQCKFRIIEETKKGKWRTTVGPELKAEQGGIFWMPNEFVPIEVTFKDKYGDKHTGYFKELDLAPNGKLYPVIATVESYLGMPDNYQIDWNQMPAALQKALPKTK